jgi:hypothetical protein
VDSLGLAQAAPNSVPIAFVSTVRRCGANTTGLLLLFRSHCSKHLTQQPDVARQS